MSLHRQETSRIPEETVRVARAIFAGGDPRDRIVDAMPQLVQDRD